MIVTGKHVISLIRVVGSILSEYNLAAKEVNCKIDRDNGEWDIDFFTDRWLPVESRAEVNDKMIDKLIKLNLDSVFFVKFHYVSEKERFDYVKKQTNEAWINDYNKGEKR